MAAPMHIAHPTCPQIILPGPACITSVAVGAVPQAGSWGTAAGPSSVTPAYVQMWGKDARNPHAARFEALSGHVQQPKKGTVQVQLKVGRCGREPNRHMQNWSPGTSSKSGRQFGVARHECCGPVSHHTILLPSGQ